MPYENEYADKTAHSEIVRNPDVASFLNACAYVQEPSDKEIEELAKKFIQVGSLAEEALPRQVVAIDGSRHESNFLERLPSTRVGYVQVSAVLIKLDEYDNLRTGQFVDPFRVAKLKSGHDPLSFPLPSSNVRWGGHDNVRDSFRAAVDHHLRSRATRFVPDNPRSSLRTTLFQVAARRTRLGTPNPSEIILPKCPSCEAPAIILRDIEADQTCSHCGAKAYPADALRLWEEVSNHASNASAITRFMSVVEHLLVVHYIRYLFERGEYDALSGLSFVIDGPLALFGTVAPLHRGILGYLDEVNTTLAGRGYAPVLLLGLQKTGQVVDHANVIHRFLDRNRVLLVDDDYRYKYIACREPSDNGFGSETYYGQDFIYHTNSGRIFVFGIPFPPGAKGKDGEADHYVRVKTNIANYPTLHRALKLITHFESDLYRNAVVPVALAHRYTAISLRPGGTVLDLLTRRALIDE